MLERESNGGALEQNTTTEEKPKHGKKNSDLDITQTTPRPTDPETNCGLETRELMRLWSHDPNILREITNDGMSAKYGVSTSYNNCWLLNLPKGEVRGW